ncbi:hypothetical protein BBFL7_02184 [Flavobacteria bacterium BBFL7]|nr:hypothetical protein BBFL7_02184 [Flavobacteria bacterium BBFL7]
MKNLLLTLSLLFISMNVKAAPFENIKEGDVVKLIAPIKVKSNSAVLRLTATTDTTEDATVLEKGYLFNVISINTTAKTVELLAVNFRDSKTWLSRAKKDSINEMVRKRYNDKVYTVDLEDFNRFAKLAENQKSPDRISLGIITLPFKARLTGDDVAFDTEFNFNSTANFRIKSYYNTHFNFQIGAGLGSVNLNESNTNYLNGTGGTIQAQDVRTLSILTGLMIAHKDVQLGLYAGWDHINNQKNFQWDNNGKLWVGLGIGVNIFNNKGTTAANSQDTD